MFERRRKISIKSIAFAKWSWISFTNSSRLWWYDIRLEIIPFWTCQVENQKWSLFLREKKNKCKLTIYLSCPKWIATTKLHHTQTFSIFIMYPFVQWNRVCSPSQLCHNPIVRNLWLVCYYFILMQSRCVLFFFSIFFFFASNLECLVYVLSAFLDNDLFENRYSQQENAIQWSEWNRQTMKSEREK